MAFKQDTQNLRYSFIPLTARICHKSYWGSYGRSENFPWLSGIRLSGSMLGILQAGLVLRVGSQGLRGDSLVVLSSYA